jgi:hypothetical protein
MSLTVLHFISEVGSQTPTLDNCNSIQSWLHLEFWGRATQLEPSQTGHSYDQFESRFHVTLDQTHANSSWVGCTHHPTTKNHCNLIKCLQTNIEHHSRTYNKSTFIPDKVTNVNVPVACKANQPKTWNPSSSTCLPYLASSSSCEHSAQGKPHQHQAYSYITTYEKKTQGRMIDTSATMSLKSSFWFRSFSSSRASSYLLHYCNLMVTDLTLKGKEEITASTKMTTGSVSLTWLPEHHPWLPVPRVGSWHPLCLTSDS